MQRVLLTGAAGRIGRMLRQGLTGRYPLLRLTDRFEMDPPGPGEEVVLANLENADEIDAAMEGIDTVVHMGGKAEEGTWEVVHTSNILGAYNTFEAARKHGVKRFVFASSLHVIGYYRREETIDGTVMPRPDSRYGAAKAFGEALGRFHADKHGMSVICQRIGSYQELPLNERMLATWISHRDMLQLTRVCIEAPLDVHFEIVYGRSGNTRHFWDNSVAERLGYAPEDNAEDYADEIMAAVEAAGDAPAEVSASMTHEDVVAAVAKGGKEPENARLFHGGPFCGMEFTGDLSKIE